jgi:hypothetical protein
LSACIGGAQSAPNDSGNPLKFFGEATNCLQPCLLLEKTGAGWAVEIDYIAKTNFSKYSWLKINNSVGAKLQAWSDVGTMLLQKNPAGLTVTDPPASTTVSNIMHSVHPSSKRGLQWLWTEPGTMSGATAFSLQTYYDIPQSSNVIVQLEPLLYKVNSDGVTADLIGFPPIRLKILSTGDVQKIK